MMYILAVVFHRSERDFGSGGFDCLGVLVPLHLLCDIILLMP